MGRLPLTPALFATKDHPQMTVHFAQNNIFLQFRVTNEKS